jgi:thymidylate kinase
MNTHFLHLFECFEREQIAYCLMRDAQHPDTTEVELDILVRETHLARAVELLARLGFLPLPSHGYAPHRFFVAYDRQHDAWLKVDLVTQVAFGAPIPRLHTTLAQVCLDRRRRAGAYFLPAPECELLALLLHCVLDKARVSPAHAQRLHALHLLVTDEAWMTALLRTYWSPDANWSWLAAQIAAEAWDGLLAAKHALLRRRPAVQRFAAEARRHYARGVRKLNRALTARSPRSLRVALLAPDGAGKSTLVAAVRSAYPFPVRTLYMGLYPKRGHTGRKRDSLSRLSALPGGGLFLRLATLWSRSLQAYYHQARRRLVLFDRYTYDALLAAPRRLNRVQRGRRWLIAHACPAPDLVIVLDAPGEVLFARKGEHSADMLERQRRQYLALQETLPHLIVVDATQDADQLRRTVISLIWDAHVQRHIGTGEARIEQAVIA